MDELTQQTTQRAAQLMWLERQIEAHQRWQGWLMAGWFMTATAIGVLFGVILPLLQRVFSLPDDVTTVLILGVGVEIGVLIYMTWRIVRRRVALEHEIDQLTQ